jgi:signal peptidase II
VPIGRPAPDASATGGPARRRVAIVIGTAVGIVALDQLTKAWAVASLADGPVRVIGDFAQLRLTRNSGAAFSSFRGATPLLAVGAIVVAVLLVRLAARTTDTWLLVGLSLFLGGALGNLCDRIFRAPGVLSGHVVDFVDVGRWPTFNVADSALTIGAVIVVVRSLWP